MPSIYEVKGTVSWPEMTGFPAGEEEVTERYVVDSKHTAVTRFFDEYSEIGWKVNSWPSVEKVGEVGTDG